MSTNQTQKQQLSDLIHQWHHQGKSPATSTNYSFRGVNGEIFVSRSGVDKAHFVPEDFMEVDLQGQPQPQYQHLKPSAETLIHCFLYRHFPHVSCVLHPHSLANTVLSSIFLKQKEIVFSDYEVIKGIQGNHTHDIHITLPIFANNQDMTALCAQFEARQEELNNYGFLISKHGLYTWGKDIQEAKRHLEVWEFMLECELNILKISP